MPTNVGGIPLGELNLGVQASSGSAVNDSYMVSTIAFNQTLSYNATLTIPILSNLKLNQSLIAHKATPFLDILNFKGTVVYTKGKSVAQKINFDGRVQLTATYTREILTPYYPTQTFSYNSTLHLSVTSNLNFTDSWTQAIVQDVYNTLSFNQTIIAHASKGMNDTIEWTDSVTYNKSGNILVEHFLELTDTFVGARNKDLSVKSVIGYIQFVGHHRVFNKTFEDTLNWTQSIAREVFVRSIESELEFNQTVAYTPIYSHAIVSNLNYGHTLSINASYARNIISNLIFLPSRQVYIGMGDVPYYTIDNVQYVKIPSYKVGKKNVPHCILQVANSAITMPAPDWGDAENYGGVFTIKRSMNGVPYTHVRTLHLRKIKLPWTIAKRKAWELREFLIQHNAELMTLTTWKGDKWFVNLTTNPFELAVKGRYDNENEKVHVELEFEGLKVM